MKVITQWNISLRISSSAYIFKWQHSTVQYSTVQYSTVQYSTVQYSVVQYSTEKYSREKESTYFKCQWNEPGLLQYREGEGAPLHSVTSSGSERAYPGNYSTSIADIIVTLV